MLTGGDPGTLERRMQLLARTLSSALSDREFNLLVRAMFDEGSMGPSALDQLAYHVLEICKDRSPRVYREIERSL